jgi:hypothetical protein
VAVEETQRAATESENELYDANQRSRAGRQKGQAMHRKLTAVTGGLVLAFALAIPAAANAAAARPSSPARPASTQHGCGILHDQGNGKTSIGSNDVDLAFFTGGALYVCNDGIAINGEFEMGTDTSLDSGGFTDGCFEADPDENVIDINQSCGGDGQVSDRWTATSEGTSGGATIWEFKNQGNGDCMYNDAQSTAIYAACTNKDHFEWFTWPQSNL